MIYFFQGILALMLATFLNTANANPADISFLIDHSITETDDSGVTRVINFSERFYRQNNTVWVERVIPNPAYESSNHEAGINAHKHLDLGTAARWIAIEKEALSLRLVDHHDKTIINVPAPEYSSVGFDGNWDNAYHLLDPKQLKNMKQLSKTAPAGFVWYEMKSSANIVHVLWDKKLEIPRKVESVKINGNDHKSMRIREVSKIKIPPWSQLNAYTQKDYSDYLD